MPHSYDEVHELAHALPEKDRIRLADSLYESVHAGDGAENEAEVAAAWDAEIKRRLDEIDSGAVELIPGEQVRREMLEKLSPAARERLKR